MSQGRLRHLLTPRRLRLWLRLTAVAAVVFGPIAASGLAIHMPAGLAFGYAEVNPTDGSGPSGESVLEYLATRNPAVDRLLPDGAGGTRFFEDLDGMAGMAFLGATTIGLQATRDLAGWPEATELHERAHLLDAFAPEKVARWMARLPAPRSGEYAATSRQEHFAEMAAAAWEVVAPPNLVCVEATPVDRLRDAEARVPGTAGFVEWYLRHLSRMDDMDDESAEDLARTAAELAAPYEAESEALWSTIEARRLPDGGFRPWARRTVRQFIEAQRAAAVATGGWLDRAGSYLLLPSLVVLAIAGR